MALVEEEVGIKLVLNERLAYTVKETEQYYVDLMPMIYNTRVVLTPKDDPSEYVAGWCYETFRTAALAAYVWNVDEEWEPAAFKKCAVRRHLW